MKKLMLIVTALLFSCASVFAQDKSSVEINLDDLSSTQMKHKGKLDYSYDKEADVLYMSYGKPVPAMSIEMGNGALVRIDPNPVYSRYYLD